MEKNPLVAGILQVVMNKLQGVELTEENYQELHDAVQVYLELSGVISGDETRKNAPKEERPFIYPDLKWPV